MSAPKTALELLSIDEERAVAALEGYVRGLSERRAAGGVLVGVSGGLDSAVLASIAARALGPSSVRAVYLFDRDHPPCPGSDAALVARWLGIGLESRSIESAGREGSADEAGGSALASLPPTANRLLYRGYLLLVGETPFVSSLRAGGSAASGRGMRDRARRLIGRYTDEIFDRKHRLRRQAIESMASATGMMPLGGANRSEWETGWFVPGGIDDLPHQPLLGLYKTQVGQIARFLGVPGRILRKAPSPDMLPGIDDEFALGMSYAALDIALDLLAGGTSGVEAAAAGVSQKQIRRAREMRDLSGWKRKEPAGRFPADGSREGGLRTGPRQHRLL
ncbi:MAG: NAD(+) synthase [Candidatus Krumholzibacteria bacterium]|nr:NAD(+) synthase [Candidatus Krumholzibacteria bacterium]